METIFDHEINEFEIWLIMGKVWTKEDYLKVITHQQEAYVDLWRLYQIRRDYDRARFYFDKIENLVIRRELSVVDRENMPLYLK